MASRDVEPGSLRVPTLGGAPEQLVVHDAQVGSISDVPLVTRLLTCHELARARSALGGGLSPDLLTQIAFVAEDATNMMFRPRGAARRRCRRGLQVVHDLGLGDARDIPVENLFDNRRLGGDDLPAFANEHRTISVAAAGRVIDWNRPIAVRFRAGMKPMLELAFDPALDLVLQLLDVELVDDAVHGDQGLGLVRRGVDTLRDEDNPDAAKGQLLDGANGIGGITGQAGRIVDQDDIEGTRRAGSRVEESLNPWTACETRARDPGVKVDLALEERPSLTIGV